jgi:hypothetical protein
MIAVPAYCTPVFFYNGNDNSNVANVVFNSYGPQSASLVKGTIGPHGSEVDFSSGQTLIAGGGQANVESDGLIHDLTISLPGGETFDKIILEPETGMGRSSADITVVTTLGTYYYGGAGANVRHGTAGGAADSSDRVLWDFNNGQNYMTICVSGSEQIESVTLTSVAGFSDLKQPRIGGVGVTPNPPTPEPVLTPEPASMLMLAPGLGLLVWRRRRVRRVVPDSRHQ